MKSQEIATWALALKTYVETTGILPPAETYITHPAWPALERAMAARRAKHPAISSAMASALILRETIYHKGQLTVCGWRSRDEVLDDIKDCVRVMREYPDGRRCRGEMWRYWQREKLICADLLDDMPPECKATQEAWRIIRAGYVPDYKQLTTEGEWIY